MLRVFLGFLLCAFLVCGCDQKSKTSIVGAVKCTETSVCFEGGVGVDFGVKPLLIKKERKQYGFDNMYFYEFPGSLSEIEQKVALAMDQVGGAKYVRSSTKNSLSVVYLKGDKTLVAMRYRQIVLDGLKRKVLLTVSWRR